MLRSEPPLLQIAAGTSTPELLAPFNVLTARQLPIPGGLVTLQVIGASSIVLVERGPLQLAEILSCIPIPPIPGGVRAESSITLGAASHAALSCQADGWSYEGRVATEPAVASPRPQAPADLLGSVEYRFAAEAEAWTRIEASLRGDHTIEVATWHDYPEYGVVVRSTSRWTL